MSYDRAIDYFVAKKEANKYDDIIHRCCVNELTILPRPNGDIVHYSFQIIIKRAASADIYCYDLDAICGQSGQYAFSELRKVSSRGECDSLPLDTLHLRLYKKVDKSGDHQILKKATYFNLFDEAT